MEKELNGMDDKYVIFTDTICEGFVADKDENGNILLYTKEEAENELKDIQKTFEDSTYEMMLYSKYIENYKTIYYGKR